MIKQMIDRIWSGGTSPQDSDIYALIHEELSTGQMDTGLWTKATAVSDGNTAKAKSRYIEMRANAIRAERKERQLLERQVMQDQLRYEKYNAKMQRIHNELNELQAEESRIESQIWCKFESPEGLAAAKKNNRKRLLVKAFIFLALLLTAYLLSSDVIVSIGGMIVISPLWLLRSGQDEEAELKGKLSTVRSKIQLLSTAN
jgi:hypothetical protein